MKLSAIILAAGKGTRMKSSISKVMHKLAGVPLLEHTLRTVAELSISDIKVVASDDLKDDKDFIKLEEDYGFSTHLQKERKGTGHAVKTAMDKPIKNPVLILSGDVPLILPETIEQMVELYEDANAKLLCLGFDTEAPTGYGRLVSYQDDIIDIVEEKDATEEQRKLTLCNSGIYLVDGELLGELVEKLKNNNAAEEYYITDIVKLANDAGHRCVVHVTDEAEVMGVNDKIQLAQVEWIIQQRLREQHMLKGVTMIDPESVYLSLDTKIGKDVVIHPNVVIGEGVSIAEGTEVLPFSHLVECKIGAESVIGPFTRIRPDTNIGKHCKVGTFVEVKAAELDDGVKARHLSFIGDAKIGSGTNVGAGTIFCNYDGYYKHKSEIGKNVFVGSNTAFVSPIHVGDGSIVGAGSVITEDVGKNSLAIARARQTTYEQRADLVREKKKQSNG